jgi:hypothetical protein
MWKKVKEPVDAKHIKISVNTTFSMTDDVTSEMIRNKLFDELFLELKKHYSEYAYFQKEHSPDPFIVEYTAEMTVVPRGVRETFVDKYKYEVQGQEFTHEQIEKAVQKTYPEYFI